MRSFRSLILPIKDYGDSTRGFKTSGGIKSVEGCAAFLELADDIMGPHWVSRDTFRFGASRALDDVLAALEGGEANPGEGY
ncbi:MAG: hypothetical protein AAGD96_25980 [Chloroflexota bacterium]